MTNCNAQSQTKKSITMKKILLFINLLAFSFYAMATIHHVDNKPNRPSGYSNNLQLTVNAAQNGDTIYLYASNTSYGNLTVDKKLHVFGEGYTINGPNSALNYLYLDTSATNNTNCSGSSFQGLRMSRVYCNKPNISNIVFAGNYHYERIYMGTNCPGWMFINNYITNYIDIGGNPSVLITNNFFTIGNGIRNSSSKSVVISHNIFFSFSYLSVTNAIIKDNIFLCYGAPNSSNMNNNTFYNNLSWQSALSPYALPPEGNTGSGNFSNQQPDFETALSTSYSFDASKDYHLTASSPGKNGASDGTDVGPYGGSSPFVWGGSFSIPRITEAIITNPVINQSTPINVNVKANSADL
jgi:hypothetical protein